MVCWTIAKAMFGVGAIEVAIAMTTILPVGFLGSSNLALPGLAKQGELNVDVLDHDACHKLQKWFDDRWKDYGCIDIYKELAEIIDESWAREQLIPPYHIYLKIAYHLSGEAIACFSSTVM